MIRQFPPFNLIFVILGYHYCMDYKLRIEGIYDKRTLKFLKQKGVKDFTFDFSPTSFNFIQEYVFLDLLKLLDSNDRIFLHFNRSNDPMVSLLCEHLKKEGIGFDNIFFEFDAWSTDKSVSDFQYNYLLKYSDGIDYLKYINERFKGFVFCYSFFENLNHLNLIQNFCTTFFTRYHHSIDNGLLILKIDWNDNVRTTLFEYFDFNFLSLPINNKIEICYRNVDLNKLGHEMAIFQRNSLAF